MLHLSVWTLVPAMFQKDGPLDVIEGLAWGREWQWGYSKHPPLAPWLTELFGGAPHLGVWPVYLLSQLCVVGCFWAVWRLAREFVPPRLALLAVVLQEGVTYFNFTSPEFNPNVLQLPLWALAALTFYLAMKRERLWLWAACGCCLGLSLLAKYYSAMLIITLAAVLLLTPEGRASLRRPGPYASALVAALVFAPHLLWAARHHFITVTYGLGRAGGEKRLIDHLLYPAEFVAAQALAIAPFGLLLALLLPFRGNRPRRPASVSDQFLAAVTLGPFLLTVALSLLFGWQLRSMWGTPLWSFTGVAAVFWLRPEVTRARARLLGAAVTTVLCVTAAAYADTMAPRPRVMPPDPRGLYPGRQLAKEITTRWRARTGRPLQYVAGEVWIAGNVAYYSPDRPSTYIDADRRASDWIREDRLRAAGAVLVWEDTLLGRRRGTMLLRKFPRAEPQPPLTVPARDPRLPKVRFGWALVPPSQ